MMRRALRRLLVAGLGAAAVWAGGLPLRAGLAEAATTGPVSWSSGTFTFYNYDPSNCGGPDISTASFSGTWIEYADAVTFTATVEQRSGYCTSYLSAAYLRVGNEQAAISFPACYSPSGCTSRTQGVITGLPADSTLSASIVAYGDGFDFGGAGSSGGAPDTGVVQPDANTQPAGSVSLTGPVGYPPSHPYQLGVTVNSNLRETTTWTITQQQLDAGGSVVATNTFGLSVPGNGSATYTVTNQQWGGGGDTYRYAAGAALNGLAYTAGNTALFANPPAPEVAAASTTVALSWPGGGNGVEYDVFGNVGGCGGGVDSGWLGAGSTAHTFSGLTPDTAYDFCIQDQVPGQPVTPGGWLPTWWLGAQPSPAWTLANPPGSAAVTGITQTSLAAVWSVNGNPSGTTYQVVLRRPEDGAWLQSPTTTAAGYTFTGLACGTQYDVWVRAENGAGVWTGFDVAGSPTTVPCPPGSLTGSDGGLGWSQTAGRGWVALSWPAVQGATGYHVWIFDGNQYESVDVGHATSWDSRQWLGYPRAGMIASWGDNSQCGNVFLTGAQGSNLRDDPNGLYLKTCGTAHDGAHNYWFYVSAYNASGDSGPNRATGQYNPTLPPQTDDAPPQVTSITLNGGKTYVYGQTVPIRVTATDDLSGICALAISSDDVSWSTTQVDGCTAGQVAGEPTAYTYDGTVALTAGPGTKTAYVKVQDVAGNWSAVGTATTYEQAAPAPTVSLEINDGAQSAAMAAVTLTVQATDTRYPQNRLQMQFSNDANTWSGWQPYTSTAGWVIAGSPGTNTVYVQVQNPQGAVGQAAATIAYYGGGSAQFTPPRNEGTQIAYDGVTAWDTPTPLVSASFTVPSGSVSMELSLDDVTWSRPQAATGTVAVTLPAGDGLKTVYAKYLNGSNQATLAGPDYFVLDTTPPTIQSATWLNGAAATAGGSQTLVLVASDNITPVAALQVTVGGGATWSGTLPANGQIPLTFIASGYVTVTITVADQVGNSAVTQRGIYD